MRSPCSNFFCSGIQWQLLVGHIFPFTGCTQTVTTTKPSGLWTRCTSHDNRTDHLVPRAPTVSTQSVKQLRGGATCSPKRCTIQRGYRTRIDGFIYSRRSSKFLFFFFWFSNPLERNGRIIGPKRSFSLLVLGVPRPILHIFLPVKHSPEPRHQRLTWSPPGPEQWPGEFFFPIFNERATLH